MPLRSSLRPSILKAAGSQRPSAESLRSQNVLVPDLEASTLVHESAPITKAWASERATENAGQFRTSGCRLLDTVREDL
jgi:hypothetical protein